MLSGGQLRGEGGSRVGIGGRASQVGESRWQSSNTGVEGGAHRPQEGVRAGASLPGVSSGECLELMYVSSPIPSLGIQVFVAPPLHAKGQRSG